MSRPELIREVNQSVGTLKINRPEKGNTLSPSLLIDLHLTLKQWEAENAVRVAVITGNSEKAFSAGYDITAIPTEMTPEAAELLKTSNPLELALNSVKNCPFPTIAMINGYCFGAGLNLAMCCDIRIGADHIKAGMPPAKLGLIYHPEGLNQFIEVIGISRTRELFLTARTYQGSQVSAMGLVDHMVPLASLSETVYQMAKEIEGNAPLSVRGMKTIINILAKTPSLNAEDRDAIDALLAEAFNSHDLKEGQTAFVEKRKPVFIGK